MKRLAVLVIGVLIMVASNAQVKISELTSATALGSGDRFVVVQGGSTKSMAGRVILKAVEDTANILRYEFSNYAITKTSRVLYYQRGPEHNEFNNSWSELMNFTTSIGDIGLGRGQHIRIKGMVSPYLTGQTTYNARLVVSHESVVIGTLTVNNLGEQEHVTFDFDIYYQGGFADLIMRAVSTFSAIGTPEFFEWHEIGKTASLTDPDELLEISLQGYGAGNEVVARFLAVELIVD
jgi:hypothetical protein